MTNRIRILNGSFDNLDLSAAVEAMDDIICSGRRGWLATVNVAILMQMRTDRFLQGFVDRAAYVVADGQPLIWVSRWLGTRLRERVAGVDVMTALAKRAAQKGYGVYLLGGKQRTVERLAEVLRDRYPTLIISGVADGYFDVSAARERALAVAASGAKLLFVGMGVPRQERFLFDQWEALGVGAAVAVGGSFDVLAGERARAPRLLQHLGLEWAFRLAQEPRRLFRRYMVTNCQFLLLIARELLRTARRRSGRGARAGV